MWDQIKQIYKEKYNVDSEIIELVAVMDILKAFVSGMSNKHISEHFEIDEEAIQDILMEYLGCFGWEFDLDINPIRVYNSFQGDEKKFKELLGLGWFDFLYNACKKYKEYERKLNDEYYRTA